MAALPGVDARTIHNRVGRGWDEIALGRCWISGITYLGAGEGWMY